MTALSGFRGGVRAAVPIAAAYLPVAFALGAASSRFGFSVIESALWSLVMFSGANQALMLSSVASGVSLTVLALLCIAASLRHLLYGMVLRTHVFARPLVRATFAYGLTDEVFATALTAANHRKGGLAGSWLVGLGMAALTVWVLGTALGNAAGDVLQTAFPGLSDTLDFALPALFVALVQSTFQRAIMVPMAAAACLAVLMVAIGRPELAIPAGALAAVLPARSEP